MDKFVIIAAGGIGLRMRSDKLKQFIILAGKPILMHTIQVFFNYDNNIKKVKTFHFSGVKIISLSKKTKNVFN